MKITRLKTVPIDVPLERPIATAIHHIRSVGCVLVTLETDDGVCGEGLVFTINGVRLKVFDEMIRGLAHLVEGRDPHYTDAIWREAWAELNPSGHKGITISAMSALDTACWDIVGKAAGQPLYRLFGACRDEVDIYASGGLWLSMGIDDLVSEAQEILAQGFRAMKMRIGSARPLDDVERVRAVRQAIGPDIGLMVDANQALTPKQAIRLGRMLEPFDLLWFEEPVAAHDLRGHAEVRAALETPVASGETEYTCRGMRAMIDARACDILMPDLQRMGGLSEFRKAAALAAANDFPISSHIFTEYSLAIAGSEAGCRSVEHMPWFEELFNETIELDNGKVQIPSRAGTGFTFRADAVERFRLN